VLPLSVSANKPAPANNLTVLADPGLILVMAELARPYSTSTGTPLTVIRTDSDPAQQIEQGFEAHILLSPDPTLVERLAQRGLIDVFGTHSFASTQLALVAPYRMKSKLALAKRISFAALLFSQPDLPIFVNDPTTIGGLRAQALMTGREFSHELATRAEVKTSLEDIVAAMATQESFALMLASNAVTEPDLTILSTLPESTSEPVRYDAVVLASEAMEQARSFTKFLRSPPAQAVLIRYGYQPMKSDET
jgi:molybdenum ABC transporter molybdate-binding protein